MELDFSERENQLRDELYGAIDEVSAALESGDQNRELEAGKLVEPLVGRYSELLAVAPASERDRLERTVGRILTDLRRQAGALTKRQTGRKAELASDVGLPFLLTRAPSPFLTRQAPTPPRRSASRALSVGGEIEAWCGKCKESRAHTIVVIHEGRPHRVQCVHCRSQHGYRSQPTARGSSGPVTKVAQARVVDPEAAKRRVEREKLAAELSATATDSVRSFEPGAIYKSGQVIDHPKYGRGRIESVTRGSLLVRFVDGLKPISRT